MIKYSELKGIDSLDQSLPLSARLQEVLLSLKRADNQATQLLCSQGS